MNVFRRLSLLLVWSLKVKHHLQKCDLSIHNMLPMVNVSDFNYRCHLFISSRPELTYLIARIVFNQLISIIISIFFNGNLCKLKQFLHYKLFNFNWSNYYLLHFLISPNDIYGFKVHDIPSPLIFNIYGIKFRYNTFD